MIAISRLRPGAALLGLVLAACSASDERLAGVPDVIDYNWHVRPILSENCFQCHGPDAGSVQAGLRLDTPEYAFRALEDWAGHFAIVPGDAGASELVNRITAARDEDRMPPVDSGKQLSPVQVDILRHWIDDGAEYKRHWAFITPERPPVPPSSAIDVSAQAAGLVSDAGTSFEPATDVDAFVLQRLADSGLRPSPAADRETLINRVSLTLTGLPPSLDEVDAFVGDTRPDAYEQLVDSLLASPRYAEHMATMWMDLARYSESDGFLDDHHDRLFWPYRDWVIEAFRRNMPFDEFGTWQLAGDLLPDATRDQTLATAFLRVGKRTSENGAIDAEYKAEYMVERTDNALGVAFLGLTVGCARCHDHKYDPISQRDYYALGAFFNSTDEPGQYAPGFSGIQGGPTLPWPTDTQQAAVDAAAQNVAQRLAELATNRDTVAARIRGDAERITSGPRDRLLDAVDRATDAALIAHYPFESAAPAELEDLPPPRPHRLPPASLSSLGGSPFVAPPPAGESAAARRTRELSARVPRGYVAAEMTLSPARTAETPAAVIQGPILRPGVVGQALFFDATNRGFLGRDVGYFDRSTPFSIDFWFFAAEEYASAPILNHMAENNSGRTGYRLSIEDGRLWVQLAHAPPANMIALESLATFPVGEWVHVTLTYDGSSRAAGTQVFLNGQTADMRVDHDTLTRTMLPWTAGDVFDPFVGLAFGTRFRVRAPVGSGLDELRVFDRNLQPVEVARLQADDVLLDRALADPDGGVLPLIVELDPNVAAARVALQQARAAHDAIVSAVPQVMVMGDAPEAIPTHVLNRGVYSDPAEPVVPRGLPAAFAWDASLPENRLGLAAWLFNPEQPLTARVFVNRIWQMHFGRGLVETAEDFGAQGSIPSHPELLDWLAVEFIESGWDIKALHRQIVLSSTYQQRSEITDVLARRDPANELLARGPRWRMTAEMVRDHALAVSGLIGDEIGGPSVNPYQPAGIWNPLNSFYSYPDADAVATDDHHRRSLYTFVKRNALHPSLEIFDFRPRTESIARRRRSSTPLQALVLMNDPQYLETYRQLAQRLLLQESSAGDDADESATRVLASLFRTATRRRPDAAELDVIERYHAEQLALFASTPDKAARLLELDRQPLTGDLEPTAVAALSQVAAVVMNTPDAYTVR